MKLFTGFLICALIAPSASSQTVTFKTAHGSPSEIATVAQMERLEKEYDLRPWTFTREVMVDDNAIPHSHPVLTIHTRHLKQDDELLSTYIHEQLHWFFAAKQTETEGAEEDLMRLFPDAPAGYPQGGDDRESTYLHLIVCWAEEQADIALLGPERTKTVMAFWSQDHYRWVYSTVIRDGPRIATIAQAHHLILP